TASTSSGSSSAPAAARPAPLTRPSPGPLEAEAAGAGRARESAGKRGGAEGAKKGGKRESWVASRKSGVGGMRTPRNPPSPTLGPLAPRPLGPFAAAIKRR